MGLALATRQLLTLHSSALLRAPLAVESAVRERKRRFKGVPIWCSTTRGSGRRTDWNGLPRVKNEGKELSRNPKSGLIVPKLTSGPIVTKKANVTRRGILDSGAALMSVPQDLAEAMYAAIGVNYTFASTGGRPLRSDFAKFDSTMTFTLGSGSTGYTEDKYCWPVFNRWDSPDSLLGSVFLQSVVGLYDMASWVGDGVKPGTFYLSETLPDQRRAENVNVRVLEADCCSPSRRDTGEIETDVLSFQLSVIEAHVATSRPYRHGDSARELRRSSDPPKFYRPGISDIDPLQQENNNLEYHAPATYTPSNVGHSPPQRHAKGLGTLLRAWSAEMDGRGDDIREFFEYYFDPVASIGEPLPEGTKGETFVHANRELTGLSLIRFAVGLVWEQMMNRRDQGRTLVIPAAVFQKIKAAALRDLLSADLSTVKFDMSLEEKKPFFSDGDVLCAWYNNLVTSCQTWAASELVQNSEPHLLPKGSSTAYIGNAAASINTFFTMEEMRSLPVGQIASRIRKDLIVQVSGIQEHVLERIMTETGGFMVF
ncbi:hypothetical protein M427DRAFT_43464 [Gonapodya prolifera JEL478]|uniref:Uncharacterized protein n=1 Tax=Gonapodya prolifera (strain JEL478) TaxID=1344416 RepID=A0A139AIP0_GONPJ|nr:hypothetical protein M427DRAFT_43464 [Gonapodya prolifera JEL478]|eukprot:KXS16666.1 hypothetical protein M427DRAFT_43464 [Gonapodya prolifera JEL478]